MFNVYCLLYILADFVTLLFYSLEQANKDIFAAVHQRKAELAEIFDWTGL